MTVDASELGKKAQYDAHYNPNKLFPICRKEKRASLGITDSLPFYGVDLWNHYEISWLNEKGKPVVAIAEIIYDCASPFIIESKSMKLYFNSFNNTVFKNSEEVIALAKKDIGDRIGTENLTIRLFPLLNYKNQMLDASFSGIHLDELDITCDTYETQPDFLFTTSNPVEETLCSDLLKSNCLVTHQPDWCSVQITYKGNQINHEGLLRYIVSFRNTNEFHEHCIEKIFSHIIQKCRPQELTVYGRSTRRGGLDINSYRSTKNETLDLMNTRLCRQ